MVFALHIVTADNKNNNKDNKNPNNRVPGPSVFDLLTILYITTLNLIILKIPTKDSTFKDFK